MARTNARVVLNREALHELLLAEADGIDAIAAAVIDVANPPDATPFGQGLVTNGGHVSYVGGKKVAGDSPKPRALKARSSPIVSIAGFGFPGRFQELGTVNHPAQPFLTPAVARVLPQAEGIIAKAVRPHLGRRP